MGAYMVHRLRQRKESHSFKMVWLYRREYARLSLTIIISFTLILSFLLISDSLTYHEIKDVYHLADEIAVWEPSVSAQGLDKNQYQHILESLQGIEGTSFVTYYRTYANSTDTLTLGEGQDNFHISMQTYFIGNESFFDYHYHNQTEYFKPSPLLGRLNIQNPSEVIIDETLYRLLGGDLSSSSLEDMNIRIKVSDYNTRTALVENIFLDLQVVGVVTANPTSKQAFAHRNEGEEDFHITYYPDIFISQVLLDEMDTDVNLSLALHSQSPQRLNQFFTELQLGLQSVLREKTIARAKIEANIVQKTILGAFMYIILVLNISGSFQNLVEVRKPEIGIKRALGLSKFKVIQQFAAETMYVVLLCITISMWISSIIGLLLKLYYEIVHFTKFTLYLNSFSIQIFLLITLFIAITNCYMAAYKAGQTEIIRFIKSDS